MIRNHNEKVLNFVMARRKKSGGFGAAPTLPASVEDTYHAVSILKTLLPSSKNELFLLRGDNSLRNYLLDLKDSEGWTLRTMFQYLSICRIIGVEIIPSQAQAFVEKRLDSAHQLGDGYYIMKILRECHINIPVRHKRTFKTSSSGKWRTAKELWMKLYIAGGDPEALSSTKSRLATWLQACQGPDGGFGLLPGTTSFIENSHFCLKALALLGAQAAENNLAKAYILRCMTKSGGFARKNGAAPFLDATWHAIIGLSILANSSNQ